MKINETIRKRRREMDITQEQLSKSANISIGTLCNFENGRGNVGHKKIESMMGVLGLVIKPQN